MIRESNKEVSMTKTSIIILTILLVIAHAIELTYDLGKASAPYIKATVAFIITAVVYTIDNWSKVNEFRHRVGKAFIYEYTPPVVLKAPSRIRASRIRNTMAIS
jgi:uncharacterized integral membrane protein